ncbi:major facilitator superfamily domain-containing protein [Collybia nuda]|uniref:Major facilitator superfamily domain-containing protein n=1 Tax=Collybia nuda TaxID=64659 RepID=A0A9P6CK35_9AGAR|nr:major facilitator superfamily domain-containing protein [Collybia nuda]
MLWPKQQNLFPLTMPEKSPITEQETKESFIELHQINTTFLDTAPTLSSDSNNVVYRLYKRRFVGLVGLFIMNIITAMSWPWFGPISNNMVKEFGFTLDQVNWLGNIVSLMYMPVALMVPIVVSKYGMRRCCDIGAVTLLLSAWLRFSGTAKTLSRTESYALIILGQFFASIAQPIFQIMGPVYSERWFDLKGRTTATMIVAISNPLGGAVGQLLSPLVGDTRRSILILGILSTAVVPFVFLVRDSPPIPPTFAGSKPSETLLSLLRAMSGLPTSPNARMTIRERVDFGIVSILFGTLVAGANTFAVLSAQVMQPAGYSADESGFMGACLLLSGIVAAIITAPLFDRVFTHHLALTAKILVPILAGAWLSLIWAVKPNNTGGLFAIMALIGICSVVILPVGLELGCELTRNANASSALLWFSGNLCAFVFILSEGALRASPKADPPLNMRRALIFNGTIIMISAASVLFLQGRQARKELDEQKVQRSLEIRRMEQP